jgi:HSP20 family protein
MTPLTHWIPERWRETLADLRGDIYESIQRWLPGRQSGEVTSNGQVPVLHPSRVEEADESGPLSRLFASPPAIDLDETDDEVVVTADLPGLDAEDFSVEVTGERLVIRGEKKHEKNEERRGYRYHERRYGAFARAVQLPCEVDTDKTQADYTRGVLRVTLPKTESAKAKRVKIQVRR